MSDSDDDMQTEQAKRDMSKLNLKIFDLEAENESLKVKLTKRKYDEVYAENEMLELQLQSMFAMADENKTLKADLERLKALSWDDRIKQIAEENKQLKRRNGELLVEMTDAKDELEKLKK